MCKKCQDAQRAFEQKYSSIFVCSTSIQNGIFKWTEAGYAFCPQVSKHWSLDYANLGSNSGSYIKGINKQAIQYIHWLANKNLEQKNLDLDTTIYHWNTVFRKIS